MIRVEHLRAKSVNAEVAYLNDLQRLGEIKRTEEQQHSALRRKERDFWSEAVRAHKNINPQSSTPHDTLSKMPSQLERMWQAHSQLQSAAVKHSTTSQALQASINTVVASKKKIDLLTKLVAKATRARASKIESRIADDLTDLAASSRQSACLKSTPLQPASPKRFTDTTRPEEPASREIPQPAYAQPTLLSSALAPSNITQVTPVAILAQTPPRTTSLGMIRVSEITSNSTEGATTLSFSCTLGRVGQVGLTLERRGNGTVAVRVDPGNAGILTSLLRERGNIQTRLQAMGIQIASLEVATSEGMSYSGGRGLRKTPRDDDEDIIT